MKRLTILQVCAIALLCSLSAITAYADGNETLGPPSIPIATGSGYVAKGVGLTLAQPGVININVPALSTIKQVLLYWEGQHFTGGGDNTIVVNGNTITGTVIGGPNFFYNNNGNAATPVFSTTYRADITSLNIVQLGANALSVSGLSFTKANNGAGVIVIYDDGVSASDIQILDGNDLAYRFFPAPRDATVPQTFTFTASTEARVAKLKLFFSSVEGSISTGHQRPNRITVTVGGTTTHYNNVLNSNDGEEWDTYELDVNIPAGETSVTVQPISGPGGSPTGTPLPRPASFAWITAGLSVPLPCDGKIGDFVWVDLNANGIQDPGEAGIAGVTVYLKTTGGAILATTTTDVNGYYYFNTLCAGNYVVEVNSSTLPPGLTPTTCANTPNIANNSNCSPSPVTLTTNNSTDLTIDFGYVPPPPCTGKIGDFVWVDLNANGLQDQGEPGIHNVTLYLKDGQGNLLDSTTTNTNGYYRFDGLCAGDYIVEVKGSSLPDGLTPTTCINTPGIANNSNCSPSPVTLTSSNASDLTIDFGYVRPTPPPSGQGCTPGYWKQSRHFSKWAHPYTPSTKFKDVFDNAFGNMTLLQVLQQGGGGLNALGRHTVAALLNAASNNVNYGMTAQQVITMFNAAYPGSNSSYESLKNIFAANNERGCPLNRESDLGDDELPATAQLMQNFPNPFNPETAIAFVLPEAGSVSLKIYNTLGQEIRTLVDEFAEAGMHVAVWDARDNQGSLVSSGIYFYQLRSGDVVQMKKMSVLK